ncbi:hypothetical protein [Mastigocladopsis repens]|uniref:hypothetical protein n=1 Tax=Mastigocladopsis repens TaxID=221287 RepID=UPI0002F1F396|nr:hypothetical protein [Mastigocladopsis repens]
MANIKLNDLRPVGSDFFADNESYLNELTDNELGVTGGIITLDSVASLASALSIPTALTSEVSSALTSVIGG